MNAKVSTMFSDAWFLAEENLQWEHGFSSTTLDLLLHVIGFIS